MPDWLHRLTLPRSIKRQMTKMDNWNDDISRLRRNIRPECKHYNAYVRESDPIGDAYCPDCDGLTRVSIWLNNLADMVRRASSL